jgi:SH3 domain-containing YSC84-like protein 1
MFLRILALCTILASAALAADESRLVEAGEVLEEILSSGDKSIPQDLLTMSQCAIVVPGLKKGAFIVGGKYGRGFFVCRKSNGVGWGSPAAVRVEGGSVGFQIGGAEIDVVMLVMNRKGVDRLLGSRFTLGGEGTIAAGPVGRSSTAQTDARMTAEILSWSRSRGVFAGIALQGATLRQDLKSNRELYGKEYTNRQIIETAPEAPASAAKLLRTLEKYSARK